MVVEGGHCSHTLLHSRKLNQGHVLFLALHQHLDLRYFPTLTEQVSQFKLRTELLLHVRNMQRVGGRVDRDGFLAAESEVLLIKDDGLRILPRAFTQVLPLGIGQP